MPQSASMEETPPAMSALPDDLLAGILGRLPSNSLATSRCVCKSWHDLIDDHKLLHRFVLPHSVRGLFINYIDYERPHFFSRPTPSTSPDHAGGHGRIIDSKFDFIEFSQHDPHFYGWYEVADHCNGLVLFLESMANVLHVCNPATRRSAWLPPWPGIDDCALCYNGWASWRHRAFLVFDPFGVSPPEYKVMLSPPEPRKEKKKKAKGRSKNKKQMEREEEARRRMMEWPPSPWTGWLEFSSSSGRWEEKVFVREEGGEAVGTLGDLRPDPECYGCVEPPYHSAVYWKGALYLHCRGEFESRLSLVDNKYRVIESPVQLAECKNAGVRFFLGRSEKGVYMAAIGRNALVKLLRVWTLSESGDQQTEWVPKDQSNLKINAYLKRLSRDEFVDDPKCWTLDLEPKEEYGTFHVDNPRKKNQDVSLEENVCWDSDDDDIVDVSDDEEDDDGDIPVSLEINVCWESDDDNIVHVSDDKEDGDRDIPYVRFLGFHPYKEVIFLARYGDAVAFHLNSPKLQYLGSVNLRTYNRGLRESFVYTPCLIN